MQTWKISIIQNIQMTKKKVKNSWNSYFVLGVLLKVLFQIMDIWSCYEIGKAFMLLLKQIVIILPLKWIKGNKNVLRFEV